MAESSLSRSNIRRISPVREGGSSGGIPTVQERQRADQAAETIQRGILESRRRQMVDEARKAAAPASVDPTTTATRRPMVTSPAAAQPTAAPAMARPAATSTAAPASTVPPLLARPQPVAPARQGMIDGRPANRVINDMEGNAQARGNFGAEIANRNVEKMGVQGAVADYFERNRLDRPQPEPGNMAEVRQSLVQGPPTASVAGPAQRAMLESRQRRGEALMQGPSSSAMMVRQEGPPSPLSQSGPPLSAMTVSQAGPPILARPAPEDPSLAYTLGRKTRNAPAALQSAKASAALTLAETGLAVGEAAKRSKGALNSAKAAAALTLARGARDFGAGFSGR